MTPSFCYKYNNIIEFSHEILENTNKVNKNKLILKNVRNNFINKIFNEINDILKNKNIQFLCAFYGSSISGLAIENSDIDIMVKLKKTNSQNNVSTIINYLVDELKQKLNNIINIDPICTASVPVVKIECDLTNEITIQEINKISNDYGINYENIQKLDFDITFFEVDDIEKKNPSELIVNYIKECIFSYPDIIDIIYIMKRYLFNKKLNKSHEGGISSYSLFLITLAFVKFSKSNGEVPIGSLLIEFLNYYANIDFGKTIIQPKNDSDIYSYTEMNRNSNINIIDPITGNNVAKSTYRIKDIQNCFREGIDVIIGNLYKINSDDINNNNEIDIISNCKKILEIFLKK